MNLQETIKKVLREERNAKVKLLIKDSFDKIFDSINLVPLDNELLMDWVNNEGEKIFQRNWWGVLWINNCKVYKDLRRVSTLFSMSLNEFESNLIEYLNEKYEEEFRNRPLQEIGDEFGCLEDYW